jgi:hypothetical protein
MMRKMLMLSVMAITIVACSEDSTGPRSANGGLQLRVSQQVGAASSVLEASTLDGAPTPAVVRQQVSSVEVTLTAVHALRIGASEEDESGWVQIPIVPAQSIELLALPTTAGNAMVLPRGDLQAGSYRNIRLVVENATITFREPVTVGPRIWAAATPHPLRIPGPSETRLLIPTARFEIGPLDGNDDLTVIDLVFNPGTSVQNIAATPNFILMAPVLLATPRR